MSESKKYISRGPNGFLRPARGKDLDPSGNPIKSTSFSFGLSTLATATTDEGKKVNFIHSGAAIVLCGPEREYVISLKSLLDEAIREGLLIDEPLTFSTVDEG